MTEDTPRPKPRRRTKKALERKKVLAERYVADGMSQEEAEKRAHEEMKDNGRADWRAG